VTGLHNRPSAAELVAAVAEFLETDVRDATAPDGGLADGPNGRLADVPNGRLADVPNGRLADVGSLNFHARVAANVLRIVERELRDDTAAPDLLGFRDERALAAAIRKGDLDDRGPEVVACLHALVGRRLAVAHPGYDDP